MRRLIGCILLTVGALAPTVGVSAQAKAGSIELRLLNAPSSRRNDPRARMYIIDHVHPGTSISRQLGILNHSANTVRVALYSGAADLAGGEFVPSAGRGGNDLASWMTITPPLVDVPPSREALATVTIAVPKGASSGERYGVAWAQLPTSAPNGNGTLEINRVGIRTYLSVGAEGEPASDFAIDSLTAERAADGTPVVIARVRNTGGRALDMAGSLQLTNGPGSLSAGPFAAKLGTTLGIGQSEPVTVPMDKQLPDGPWDARIDLHSGLVDRSASARITFPHEAGAASPVRTKPSPSRPLMLELVLLATLIGLFVLLILWIRGRRRRAIEAAAQHPSADEPPRLVPSPARPSRPS
jgi:hypothetical protein